MRIRHLAALAVASAAVATLLWALHPPAGAPPVPAPGAPPSTTPRGSAPEEEGIAPAGPVPSGLPAGSAPAVSARASSGPPTASASAGVGPSPGACPTGMVLVDALHCPFLAHRCADRGADGTCHRFVPEALCEGERRRARFCIDRREYPNLEGARPVARVSFAEAERACAIEDKRLCSPGEWELACEGPGLWPWPTGVRLEDGCAAAGGEGCPSPLGVLGLAGGVDEWTRDEAGGRAAPPLLWVLAGGGRAPRPCRGHRRDAPPGPTDDVGFRCCADAAAPRTGEGAPSVPPPGSARALPGWIPLDVPGPGRP